MNIEDSIHTKTMSLHKKTVVNLIYTANILTDKISEVLKPFGVSIQQFNVLRILRGQKGKPAHLSTIQERMIHKMSNTTRLVDKLISKGLVKRKICAHNRRKVEINITPKGLHILNILDDVIDRAEKDSTKNLTQEECVHLNMLLGKIRL